MSNIQSGDATPRGVGVSTASHQPIHSLPQVGSGFPNFMSQGSMVGAPYAFGSGQGSDGTATPNPSCGPCCYAEPPPAHQANHGLWTWSRDGRLKLTCEQPIVPVPVIQEIHRRDKIIEVPQVDVVDAVKPRVYNQGVEHEVPKMRIDAQPVNIEIPKYKYVEREVLVPIVTGYTHKFVPKWEIREVPRPVVKYVGEQQTIEVEVPQVKFVDRIVEKEIVVDTIEKKVPKIIEVPKYVDTVKYVWKPVEKIVHVERFVPKFDVSLECPAPLIVPYPVQKVTEMPAVMVRKNPAEIQETEVEVVSPEGTVRVPEEYIREYRKTKGQDAGLLCQTMECCGADREDEVVFSQGDLSWMQRQHEHELSADQEPELSRESARSSQTGAILTRQQRSDISEGRSCSGESEEAQ
ncbi:hypothetical protein, conserved [Eimeria necatrix]|uniref:Uncharacterized protein n=1 Tax=Eimeria necatrix TaxID=51315 RepID=U6MH51_9EIME|nr:hypothetical protein, conserved [Eimeria necatrix]CDJ63537.1 hypothetical protein, conserved [Eimeria necatrix]